MVRLTRLGSVKAYRIIVRDNFLNMFFFCLLDKLSSERVKQVMEHVWKFQEFCNSMTKMEIDSYEYAYLKALVLFSPGEYASLNQLHGFSHTHIRF